MLKKKSHLMKVEIKAAIARTIARPIAIIFQISN